MYANDFNGEIIINTESQVDEFIRNRPAFNANQFILPLKKVVSLNYVLLFGMIIVCCIFRC